MLAAFQEIELFDFENYPHNREPWGALIYSTTDAKGVCWCRTVADAVSLLLTSGYYRKPLLSGGVCWYTARYTKAAS